MADSKISDLAAVTTVGDTDAYVVAVGGATKKITGANLKAAVAPVDAKYIVQTASSGLSAEQAMGALATGIVKNTTTTGVLSIATGADLPTGIPVASLADPTTGKVIGSVSNAAAAVYPPGYEFDYVAITSGVTSTQTARASATTAITGNSVTYDGAPVLVEVFIPYLYNSTTVQTFVTLWHDSTDLCTIATSFLGTGNAGLGGLMGKVRMTPTAGAHTFTVKLYVASASTGSLGASANTAAAGGCSAYLRVTKV